MTQFHFTKELLGLKEKNIVLDDQPVTTQKKSGVDHMVLHGTLTYRPDGCPACGVKNESSKDIIKHGTKSSAITLGQLNFRPLLLRLKKQRFLCKHCRTTFTATTSLVDRHCFISNPVKSAIAVELQETQSMKLIAKHFSVSSHTVIRVLRKAGDALKKTYWHLPRHLSVDEFKSVKPVSGAMSFLFIDARTHRLVDVVENRQLAYLSDYFMRYPAEARHGVETVTMDMYSPYTQLVKACFPNARIIIDRFHLVQHLNRAVNSVRIQTMRALRYTRPKDYRKLKKQWRLILKNEWDLDYTTYRSHRLYEGAVSEKMMVQYMVQLDPRLERVYTLVNRLKAALNSRDFSRFSHHLDEAKKVTLPRRVRTILQTVDKYYSSIGHAFTYTLSNGAIEGMNNKIKNIKRSGYGYRNFYNLRARILISYQLTAPTHPPRALTFEEEDAV
ncbi:ISL3 family transposase [Atopococcus tabaci]|uniref:ISL3 family transposase n=3 Tax=Atopococcus tabaci TaxID=269774 RepID=UPI002409FCFB|nr:ISL3 family transposase [Atopococcus tabaci]